MSHSRQSSVSRHTPSRSISYVQSALPDGPVDEETVALLGEFVHPHHTQDETLVEDVPDEHTARKAERQKLPWWRRPSPWWLIIAMPFSTIAMTATTGPKVEIYTLLACLAHKPEIFKDQQHLPVPAPSVSLAPDHQTSSSFDIVISNTLASTATEEYPVTECASDPVVQAAVAKLSTGEWYHLDPRLMLSRQVYSYHHFDGRSWLLNHWMVGINRYGRTKILGLTITGLLFNDFVFIFVTKNFYWIPGGYWFLIVGPILEGLLGGFASGSAASHAYLADVVSPAERSRVFALFLALVFVGLGMGPGIGGLLVKFTEDPLSVFYLAAVVHGSYTLLTFLVLPESLTKAQMQTARATYEETLRLESEQEKSILSKIKRLFIFLKPLTIFFPEPVEANPNVNTSKGRKFDWNLTLLAAAYGFTISIMGSLMIKLQYIMNTFGWTSENLGYFMTITGAARAIYLAILLPLLIKVAKFAISKRTPESDPLLRRSRSALDPSKHSPSFDLGLVRISLIVDIIAYIAMPLSPTSLVFTAATILSSFGSAFSPAVQSLAMELYTRKHGQNAESGKLFGALGVVQTLCGQIISPAVYGLIYIKTVATFPTTIFYVSTASVIASFICVSLVRLPSDIQTDIEDESESLLPDHATRDATLVDTNDFLGAPASEGRLRGRKTDLSDRMAIPEVRVTTASS